MAPEFQGGEMGRKEMRWEEGEVGGSGMGRRLRAPGERPLPSQHPTCPRGLDSPAKERPLSQATEWPQTWTLSSSPSCSPPWPTSGGCLRNRDSAVSHARPRGWQFGCPTWIQAVSTHAQKALRAHFQSGEVREGVDDTFSGRPPLATLSKEVPPCYSLVRHPVHFLLRAYHSV